MARDARGRLPGPKFMLAISALFGLVWISPSPLNEGGAHIPRQVTSIRNGTLQLNDMIEASCTERVCLTASAQDAGKDQHGFPLSLYLV